ncbi:MAG: lysylphosphatidylglycerol synthase domain-containing protein, partial [Candidatus Nanopelagicales bacterium]
GQAAPTPGGLGAVEAALTAALAAAGVEAAVAVSAVLLFRIFTFWLPTLPGWLFFNRMTKNGYL